MPAETLLTTKLRVPPARPDAVARPRLVARLQDGLRLSRRLSLVCGPPGFGKTTLLAQWAGAADQAIAWLALDETDSDPIRFVRYLVAALQQADGTLAVSLAEPAAEAAPAEQLAALINSLAASGTGALLVLDDMQTLTGPAVPELLTRLLAHQPPNLHLAIGTREDPPLPLARLRARNQLTEIREHDLRFTREEAAAFLTGTMALELPAQAVAALATRTEGWVTALQLAGLALREQDDPERFVAAFAGDDRYVVDYLLAEALSRRPEPVRAFLRATCILERLCAPLCDALTGRDDSQSVLEHLETANCFLVPLDSRRRWYRYHVLFAEALRLSLGAQERAGLHQRASAWFAAQELADLAQHHARLAAQVQSAGSGPRPPVQPLIEPLSARELEVLQLIAEGYANAEIAARLYITLATVKTHINNIYGKLGVGSRTQAVAKARGLGLLP